MPTFKVLVFHKSPRLKRLKPLFYRGLKLDYCRSYIYLGVPFSASGKFKAASDFFLQKSVIAGAKVRDILIKSKSDAWETKMALFDSMVASTTLYCSEVWALRYLDVLETAQTKFLRSLFYWSQCTPHYMIRLETGRAPLSSFVFKRIINYWTKLLSLPEDRLPKQCFRFLCSLDTNDHYSNEYNWVSMVRSWGESLGDVHIFHTMDSDFISNDVVDKLLNTLLSKDIDRALNSKFSSTYRRVTDFNYYQPQTYLKYKINFEKLRIVSQLRLSGDNMIKLFFKGSLLNMTSDQDCPICQQIILNPLNHLLVECQANYSNREKFLEHYLTESESDAQSDRLLNLDSIQKINSLFLFILNTIRKTT